jgi:hypothetical protein
VFSIGLEAWFKDAHFQVTLRGDVPATRSGETPDRDPGLNHAGSLERFPLGLRTRPGVDDACRERRSPDRLLAPDADQESRIVEFHRAKV